MRKNIERDKSIFLMRESGKTYAEVSKVYGISEVRAREIYANEVRRIRIEQEAEEVGLNGLSIRTYYALKRAGISTKEELIDMLKSKGGVGLYMCGSKAWGEIEMLVGFPLEKIGRGWISPYSCGDIYRALEVVLMGEVYICNPQLNKECRKTMCQNECFMTHNKEYALLPGECVTLDTRAESHETVDKQKRYSQIMECLQQCGPLTAKECAVIMMQKGYIPTSERNFTAPRLTELSQNGLVEPVGKKLCAYTGKKVAVYALREVS